MLKINEIMVFREIEGKGILLNLEEDQYYTLNELGSVILKKITTQQYSKKKLVSDVMSLFDQKLGHKIENDINEFIDLLESEHIIMEENEVV